MKKTITLLAFALLFCAAASAFSTKYHATVAYIAEQHMTPKAKKNFYKAFGNRHLTDFSSLPDFYRSTYAINGKRTDHIMTLDAKLYPVSKTAKSYTAYDALVWAVNQLKDYRNLDDSLKVVALGMMSHFVGDSHCPSHKAFADDRCHIGYVYFKNYYTEQGEGTQVAYHYFWDYFCMDQRYSGGFMEMAYMIDTCTEEEIRLIQQGGIEDWMHSTAVECSELYDVKTGDVVDRAYVTDKAAGVARQVRNAGYRLAALMNRIFGEENAAPAGKVAVVAHRGFWKCEAAGYSENSIASLKCAQEAGFWGSEFDVQLTADDVVMVNHNADILAPDSTLLKISEHKFSEFEHCLLPNGERRPTLDEYLAQGAKFPATKLILELKQQDSPEREDVLLDKVFESLKKAGLFSPDRVAFISFSLHITKRIAKEAPSFGNQYLNGELSPSELKKLKINGMDYHLSVFRDHPEWIAESRSKGIFTNVWTVNSDAYASRMIDLGVRAITTNTPLSIRALLGKDELTNRR